MIMWLQEVYQRLVCQPARRQTRRRQRTRLGSEQLEDRQVLSNFTAATVSHLVADMSAATTHPGVLLGGGAKHSRVADINAANRRGGPNIITLIPPATSPHVLTLVSNTSNGANGLPVIAKHDALAAKHRRTKTPREPKQAPETPCVDANTPLKKGTVLGIITKHSDLIRITDAANREGKKVGNLAATLSLGKETIAVTLHEITEPQYHNGKRVANVVTGVQVLTKSRTTTLKFNSSGDVKVTLPGVARRKPESLGFLLNFCGTGYKGTGAGAI
jgi:hypothetical protein